MSTVSQDSNNQYVFSEDGLQKLLERLGQAAPREQVHKVNWTGMKKLDLDDGVNLDTWFEEFEQRVLTSGIPPASWHEAFIACPHVPSDARQYVTGHTTSYTEIRKTLLLMGPKDPANYWNKRMYKVKGDNAQDVARELRRILSLYNRALRDVHGDRAILCETRDLCWAFTAAFPPEIEAALEAHIGPCLAMADPFDQLQRFAPQKNAIAAAPLFLATSEAPRRPWNQPPRPLSSRPDRRVNQRGRVVKIQPPERPCYRCGRIPSCTKENCPAVGATCHHCGKSNHYSSMCRSKSNSNFQQRPPFAAPG